MDTSIPTKFCKKCSTLRKLDEFHKNKANPDGLQYRCKACSTKDMAAYVKKKGPEWRKQFSRRYEKTRKVCRRRLDLKTKYGITPAEYDKMLAAQGGGCAICQSKDAHNRWGTFHVDHNHDTGKVRGILCNRCNSALGLLGDDMEGVLKFVDYLTKYDN